MALSDFVLSDFFVQFNMGVNFAFVVLALLSLMGRTTATLHMTGASTTGEKQDRPAPDAQKQLNDLLIWAIGAPFSSFDGINDGFEACAQEGSRLDELASHSVRPSLS